MRKVEEIILNLDEYAYLATMFGDRSHPNASRLHYAIAKIESQIMSDIVDGLAVATGGRAVVNVMIFDGLIVRVAAEDVDAAKTVFTDVGEKWDVVVKTEAL